MSDCIFCKIANNEFNTDFVFESDEIVAFHDMSPQAPVHVLVIPKKHIQSVSHLNDTDSALIGDIFLAIQKIASDLGLENGYRVVANTGPEGGQTVNHLHFHVLGKRQMQWPPG